MTNDNEITVDRQTLEVLLGRAARQAPVTPDERRAEQDVRELLALVATVPADQLSLFDAAEYDETR